MSDINNLNYSYPIITGRPQPPSTKGTAQPANAPGESFGDLLRKSIATTTQAPAQQLTFSKHARNRTLERGIQLSQSDIDKLASAVGTAADKGINDTLVMMNNTAFIVNVPSRVVVTVVDGSEQENVFTNIDGAVIV